LGNLHDFDGPANRWQNQRKNDHMAQIRHLAIIAEDPEKLAKFYAEVFGMKITGVGQMGAYWLSDGTLELALIPHSQDTRRAKGINHFGFTFDSKAEREAVCAELRARGIEPFNPGPNRPYVEDAAVDIEGNRYDLSLAGLAVEELK
jgi:catechol 2,3-dioxygenase-like lactoylglutathione lyase family enzyme